MGSRSRAESAFESYLALGPERSLALLHRRLGQVLRRVPTIRTLENWSARYDWQARLRVLERQARERAEQEHLEWIREHRERLRSEGLFLQQRGLEWLRERKPDDVTAGESIRAIEAGFRLEALALGEATERISVEDSDERISNLSDEELEGLLSLLRPASRPNPPGTSESSA